MTNGEKYKTAKERSDAYTDYCTTHNRGCPSCPLHNKKVSCSFTWLEYEAVEEELMPCPFCFTTHTITHFESNGSCRILCIKCDYCSPLKSSENEAVCAHNRIFKAVAAHKESEVKL